MYQKTDKIWLDGNLIDWANANVHVLTHTLHYGVGAFEGIRYYDCGSFGTGVFRLEEHMKRLVNSCRILGMKCPYSRDQLVHACVDVVKANKMKEGYLRPIAFISEGPNAGVWAFDNPVRVAIMTWAWGAYLGDKGVSKGIRAKISSFVRYQPNIAMTHAKVCGQYYNSCLAKQEAKTAGYDEAIMTDSHGYVSEGTGENIFMVQEGLIKTPPLGTILPGITRSTIMTLLQEKHMPLVEQQITRDELYIAEEVFLVGTAAEVTPVCEIDLRQIGDGNPGPLTKELQKAYGEVVRGRVSQHKNWITFV